MNDNITVSNSGTSISTGTSLSSSQYTYTTTAIPSPYPPSAKIYMDPFGDWKIWTGDEEEPKKMQKNQIIFLTLRKLKF